MTISVVSSSFQFKQRRKRIGLLLRLLHDGKRLPDHRLGLVGGNVAFFLKLPRIKFAYRWMLADNLIHAGLRKGRFVALIVAPAPVADKIDQDILVELVAIGVRQANGRQTGIGVIGIDMNDGNLEALCQIAGEMRRAAILRLGGKTKLVVENDVDGTTDLIALQLPHIQSLSDHALARECGVAMNENRQGMINILQRSEEHTS